MYLGQELRKVGQDVNKMKKKLYSPPLWKFALSPSTPWNYSLPLVNISGEAHGSESDWHAIYV